MKRFNMQWTAKRLVSETEKGNVVFDTAIQRGLVWDNSKKSLLIHSMLYDYSIPAFYFTREIEDETKVFYSLDGKQRSNAIISYIKNEFPLSVDTTVVYDDDGNESNLSGMYFDNLPEWAQDRIKDYSLTIYYYEDMTENEVREFFRRLNNGKPLSAMELTRVKSVDLEKFQNIGKHEAIQSVVTDAGRKRFDDEKIAMQIYHLLSESEPDFSTKTFREWAENVHVDESLASDIVNGLDTFKAVFDTISNMEEDTKKVIKTLKTRTHFVSFVYLCVIACKYGKSTDTIASGLFKLLNGGKPTNNSEYNNTVGAGSAKPKAVQTRKNVMYSIINEMGN